MRFGPISSLDLSRLEDHLKLHSVDYHVEVSKEELDAYAELRKERTQAPRSRPTFDGVMNYIYIDIPDESVALVQDELDKLGYGNYNVTGDELNSDPEFDVLIRQREAKKAALNPFMRIVYTIALIALLAGGLWFVIRELSSTSLV